MRVIATHTGFYNGHRRRAGTEFEVKDGQTSKWFVPVKDYVPPVEPKKELPTTLSELGRKKPRSPIENLSDEI